MPGVVFHVDLFTFSFFGNEDFSPSLSLCSFSSFHPLVLCLSTPSPSPTWNEISRRMVTKSNCFIWMMHPGIYVLFFDVILIVFFVFYFKYNCVAHLNFFFHISSTFSLFCVWTGSVSSHLSCIPSVTCPIFVLCTCLMWECCDRFEWSLCCIRRLLIGFFPPWFVNHSLVMWSAHIWLCVISVLYNS